MTPSQEQPSPAASADAASLADLVLALAQRTRRLYDRWAQSARHRGETHLSALLERFATEAGDIGADCLKRLRAAETGSAGGTAAYPDPDSGSNFSTDREIDEFDSQIANAYQILAAAVRNEEAAFRSLSHFSAGVNTSIVRQLTEAMARLQLARAARLRRHRRVAFHAARLAPETVELPNPALVTSLADLIHAASRIEASAIESLDAVGKQGSLQETLAMTRQMLALLQEQAHASRPPRPELVQAFEGQAAANTDDAGTGDPLAQALNASKRGFAFYDSVVAMAPDEATMLLAQDLSDTALRRIQALAALA